MSQTTQNFPIYDRVNQALQYILKLNLEDGSGQIQLYDLGRNAVYEGLIGLPGFFHTELHRNPRGGKHVVWVDEDGQALAVVDEFDGSFCYDLCGKSADDVLLELNSILLDPEGLIDLFATDISADEWLPLPADFRLDLLAVGN
jgi:hypothetical protein